MKGTARYFILISKMTQSRLLVGADIPYSNQHLPVGAYFSLTFAPLEVSLVASIAFSMQFKGYTRAFIVYLVLNIGRIYVLFRQRILFQFLGILLMRPSQLNICELFKSYFCLASTQLSG